MAADKDLKILKYRADHGVVKAQKDLALLAELGIDPDIDPALAEEYWQKAADAGDPFACLQVANRLKTSDNPDDRKRALDYRKKALRAGYEQANEKTIRLKAESRFAGRILIVDDSEVDRLNLKKRLEKRGFNVDCAENGMVAAKKLAAKESIDMLIVDINMPHLGGVELIKRVRSVKALAKLPIIVISAETSDQIIKQARQLGINGWLVKPPSMERLLVMMGLTAA